jgi:hypothetical protein
MRQITFLFCGLLMAPIVNCTAQHEQSVIIGDHVRVWAPEPERFYPHTLRIRNHVGSVVVLNADTLMLKVKDRVIPLVIPITSITRLDVSHRRESGAGRGARTGLVVGAVAGLGESALLIFGGGFDVVPCLFCVPICSITGTGLGALIGAASEVDHWESVPLPIRIGISSK